MEGSGGETPGVATRVAGGDGAATETVARPPAALRRQPRVRPAFLPGEVVGGRFEIVRALGQGGMGQVFSAVDLELGGPLALKVIRPDLASREETVARFRHEVQLARQVTHPNVCRIYDLYQHKGGDASEAGGDEARNRSLVFLTMELLSGPTLREALVRDGPMSPATALPLIRQMAAGLAAAHRAGVVHRDFKPGNVMLVGRGAETRAVVTDFGVAAAVSRDASGAARALLPSESRAGTPRYMAPEERAGTTSPQSDLYSLGLVAYELLTGRRPVAETSAADPPRPAAMPVGLEPEIEALLLACLERDPQRRPPSARSLVEVLDRRLGPALPGLKLLVRRGRAAAGRFDDDSVAQLADGSGRRIEPPGAGEPVFAFDRPDDALRFGLALARDGGSGAAVHLGATTAAAAAPIDRASLAVLEALGELAGSGQILLSSGAFELVRHGAPPALSLRWLAHGAYWIEAAATPVEVFEVGEEGRAAFVAPADTGSIRRHRDPGAILGWRPAAGSTLPGRPHWRLVRRLGAGGFGDVWLTAHAKTHERRVLKFCYDARRLAALQREITLFRLLREELGERDDISRILDWNLEHEPYFIESEYTAGGSLVDWIATQGGFEAVPRALRLELVAQVAEALAAAHSIGVLHKDVKPANVLVWSDRDGAPRARLTDFGVGHALDRSRLEAAGITVLGLSELETESRGASGTRLYLAPELVEGRVPTVQADVYALGVLLYQLLAGDLRRSLAAGWERDVDDPLLVEDVAAAVDGVPEQRPGARQLAHRLRALAARREERDEVARLRREAEASRRDLERSRRRRRLVLIALAVTVAVAAALGSLAGRLREEVVRSRDLARLAAAGEWMSKDPTRAALVLLELERPTATESAEARANAALGEHLAWRELPTRAAHLLFGSRGDWLATAGADGVLRLWSLAGPRRPRLLGGPGSGIQGLSQDHDGRRILSTYVDGTARIWNVDGGEPIVLRGHAGRAWACAFLPDGSRVATVSEDGTGRIWNADGSGEPIVLSGHTGWVFSVAVSPDGRLVATGSVDGTARLWRADDGAPMTVVRGGTWVFVVVFSPRGDRFATATREGVVREWRLDGSPLGPPRHGSGSLYRMLYDPDGSRLLTASGDGNVYIWPTDREGDDGRRVIEGPAGIPFFAFGPGEKLTVGFSDGRVAFYSADGSREEASFRAHAREVSPLAFSPDGRLLASGSPDSAVRLWRVDRELPPLVMGHRGPIDDLAAAGEDALLSGSADGTGRLWSLTRGATVLEGHENRVMAVAASPDGRLLATGSRDDSIRIWRRDGSFVARLAGHLDSVVDLAFRDDGHLLSLSADRTLRVWDVRGLGDRTGEPSVESTLLTETPYFTTFALAPTLAVFRSFDDRLYGVRLGGRGEARAVDFGPSSALTVAVGPDGRTVATGDERGSIELMRLEGLRRDRLRRVRTFGAHASGVAALAFAPDGRRAVSGSGDGTVRVWDVEGGGKTHVFEIGETVTAVGFAKGGSVVVAGTSQGHIRLWPLDRGDFMAELRAATDACLEPAFRQRVLGESAEAAARRAAECEARPARPLPPASP